MAAIIIPRRHLAQPQGRVAIAPDWGSVFYAGTAASAFANISAPHQAASAITSGEVTASGAGLALQSTASNFAVRTNQSTPASGAGAARTWVARVFPTPKANLSRIFDKRTTGGQVELLFINASQGFKYERAGSGGLQAAEVFSGIVTSEWLTLAVTAPAYGQGVPNLYINGALLSSTQSNPSGTATANSDPYVIGNRLNDSARAFSGLIEYVYGIDRALTPDEIEDLNRYPYQIFRADPIRIYSFPSGPIIPSISAVTMSNILQTSATTNIQLVF